MSKKGVFFLLLIERLVTVSFYSVNQKTVNSLTFTLNCLQIDSQTTRKKKRIFTKTLGFSCGKYSG